jgi:hypothetical protein
MTVRSCPLPATSAIKAASVAADFADCYCYIDPHPEASPLESYLQLMAHTPAWMNALMQLRNNVVRFVGLKHLGDMRLKEPAKLASAYRVGDRMGLFSLLAQRPDEVLMHDDDKHLRVQVSLFKRTENGQPMVFISTVVHIHNSLGRVYMAVVGPVHRLIAPPMLKQASRG